MDISELQRIYAGHPNTALIRSMGPAKYARKTPR